MTPRDLLLANLARQAEIESVRAGLRATLQAEYDAEGLAEFRRVHGKRRKFRYSLLDADWRKATEVRYLERFDREGCAAELKTLRDTVPKLAEGAELQPGDWRMWRSVPESAYGSQGWGATKYAREAAERDVEHARQSGVEAELRERRWGSCRTCGQIVNADPAHTTWPPRPGAHDRCIGVEFKSRGDARYVFADFEVWVKLAEPVDLVILKHKPGVSMRDFVKQCWARGVNPRVYCPFLPHGFEERQGIDFQGREVAPLGVKSA